MGHRLSKIYTRTGDAGMTGLGDGSRTGKASARIESIGEIDELNSVLGLLRTCVLPAALDATLLDVQHDLFDLGGELAIPGSTLLDPTGSERLEAAIDALNGELPALKEFILPGGNRAAAVCHLARSVCRRAERSLVRLNATEPLAPAVAAYINRLSDYLFVAARTLARMDGGAEVLWERSRRPGSGR
ncbi:MAG: cob(I)yrinic acid a,c-diamide adenosyltransferase [Gammaproteobacteria bacterium]|nr:cob(I)yrinic acid a,c-diamide adenosyltransferase [Gammaproteobacteria bacterium]